MNKIIKFYAPWCCQCKVQGPIIENLIKDIPELDLQLESIDASLDENQELVSKYNVRSLPTTVILIENKEPIILKGITQIDTIKTKLKEIGASENV